MFNKIDKNKSDINKLYSITSDNVLVDEETGRVVAVFYNGIDLEKVIQSQKDSIALSFAYDTVCN